MPLTLSATESLVSTIRQLRLVDAGLSPLADAPARAARTYPPCHGPCPQCGALVLTGATLAGVLVRVDTQVKSYVPLWLSEAVRPVLYESRGYPVHRCRGGVT